MAPALGLDAQPADGHDAVCRGWAGTWGGLAALVPKAGSLREPQEPLLTQSCLCHPLSPPVTRVPAPDAGELSGLQL